MANQRAQGQTFIGFWANEEFVAKLDAARGSTPKSQFVRDGVAAYLRKHGFQVENTESSAPDRKGKGGPRPSSKHTPAEVRLLKKAAASGR